MINWREYPFIRILLPFLLGILLALYLDIQLPWGIYALLAGLGIIILLAVYKIPFQQRARGGILINLFFILLGYQLAYQCQDHHQSNHFSTFLGKEQWVIGRVDNMPSPRTRSIQIELETEGIGSIAEQLQSCQGKVLLYLPNDSLSQEIHYGDRLLCRLKPRLIPPPANPEAFDYRRFLQSRNIRHQAYVKASHWQKIAEEQGNFLLSWALTQRKQFLKLLQKHLPDERQYAVASALILGYKGALSEEIKTAYAQTGAMHVLAVSGLHVGLIWGILVFLLGWIHWRHPAWRWIKTGLILLGLWSFALLTGASPSVLRAATMFSFVIIGNTLKRHSSIYNTLAASAFVLLCIQPLLILEIGFQLSYLAVLSIVYFYPKIYQGWYIENRVGDHLWKLTALAIAAQIGTFPLSLYYFHQFPIYFWLSGLIVVPFAFFILGGGVFLIFTHFVLPFLTGIVGSVLHGIIWLMNAMIFLINQLPGTFFQNIWIGDLSLLLLFGLIVLLIIWIQTRKPYWLWGMGIVILAIAVSYTTRVLDLAQQKEIVFYQSRAKTYLECLDGNTAYAFGDQDLKGLSFLNANYHLKKGITNYKRYTYGEASELEDHWSLEQDFIQFYDQRIVFIDDLPSLYPDDQMSIDYLIFRNRSRVSMEEVIRFFKIGKVIFDGANPSWKVKKWKEECKQLGIAFYDLKEEGALVIEL